eukprot:gene6345-7605_t
MCISILTYKATQSSVELLTVWFVSTLIFTGLGMLSVRFAVTTDILRKIKVPREEGMLAAIEEQVMARVHLIVIGALSLLWYRSLFSSALACALTYAQQRIFTVKRTAVMHINIIPWAWARDFEPSAYFKSYEKLGSSFVFLGGALGQLDGEKFRAKRAIQAHLRHVAQGSTISTDFEYLQKMLKNGQAGLVASRISQYYRMSHLSSYWEAFFLASLLWRLNPVSPCLIRLLFLWLSKQPIPIKQWCTELIAETALMLTTDPILLQIDEVALRGTFKFHSESENVVVVRDQSNHVYDSREKYIFGDGKAFCPGRFLVTDIWLRQAKFEPILVNKERATHKPIEASSDDEN